MWTGYQAKISGYNIFLLEVLTHLKTDIHLVNSWYSFKPRHNSISFNYPSSSLGVATGANTDATKL